MGFSPLSYQWKYRGQRHLIHPLCFILTKLGICIKNSNSSINPIFIKLIRRRMLASLKHTIRVITKQLHDHHNLANNPLTRLHIFRFRTTLCPLMYNTIYPIPPALLRLFYGSRKNWRSTD